MGSYKIYGKIIKIGCTSCAAKLRIEAWDADCSFDDNLGSTITNSKGEFTIKFDSSKFKDVFTDHSPDYLFQGISW